MRIRPDAAKRLAAETPALLALARDRVYVGRTMDPHRRAMNWKMEMTNSLGRTLRRLANLGYICYKDYIPMCRVWFCLIGPKNTHETTWDAPETAFKMMVARSPNKLHIQAFECTKTHKSRMGSYRMSTCILKRSSEELEAEADAILAGLFIGGKCY